MYKKGFKIEYAEKQCKICSQIKPISSFYKRTDRVCKRCRCEINAEKSYQRHLEKFPDLPDETWKDVVGYEGLYRVSNLGRIRSFVRGGQRGCILALTTHRQGYKIVKFYDRKSYLVHRLVAESFIPNPEDKATVNHIDGNKANNRISNLEWATQSENNKHAFLTGLKPFTQKQFEAATRGHKIDKSQVFQIRNLFDSGKSLLELSKAFHVSKAQVCRIVNHKSRCSV